MTDEKKVPYYSVYVRWQSCSPDRRQWKPSTPILLVDKLIQIDVPLTAEYFANSDKILVSSLSNQDLTESILTPVGMRYIIDQLESVMSDKQEVKENTIDETEWEETEKPTTEKSLNLVLDWEENDTTNDTLDENEIEWES